MKKSDRQLAYILLLQTSRCLTAQQLAERFEVCQRTVYRDIQALSEAGVPIVSLPGKGYGIMETYFLPAVHLTVDEAVGLYIGSQLALRQTDASVRPDLHTAMLKIESVLPTETRTQLGQLKESIHLDTHHRGRPDDGTKILAPINRAILERRLLRVQYRAFYTDELTEREVEPLWLLYYSTHWHLIGYCRLRHDLRDFRTDRIQGLAMREETFAPRPQLSLAQYLTKHERYRDVSEVTVRFSQKAARYAREWFHWLSYTEQDLGESVVMTLLVERPEWMSWWLLSFGAEAEVLSPESLRRQVADTAWRVITVYDSPAAWPSYERRSRAAVAK
jgi:predicted DNA-binding transcriptional regulator YafY